MRRAGVSAAVALGVVAVVGIATWLVVFRDTAEPVTVEEAVTSFRTETEPTPSTPSPIVAGVYVYATQGYERTDALAGVTHRYPRRSTIAVAPRDCGVSLTWRVLKGRSTEWVYCASGKGWSIASQDERHTFFGSTQQTTYTCTTTPVLPAEPSAGMRWRVLECGTEDTKERGSARVVALTELSIGGVRVPTVHVRKSTRFAGAIRGRARHDLWFDRRSGLPVRIAMVSRTTNDSPIGAVTYEEAVTLRLLSLEPRR
ncbi:MAG TPA: hypothetical protein VFU99_00440 [Gaiellaceae bacterium]|nr:hypothetical protein [Gaiellaceae bacterium]